MAEDHNENNIGRLFTKQEETNVNLARLEEVVRAGFKGVYRRQDTTNGRIAAVENDTKEIESKASANSRRIKEFNKIHKEQRENRKWLKREVILSILSIFQVVLTASILLFLGLKG